MSHTTHNPLAPASLRSATMPSGGMWRIFLLTLVNTSVQLKFLKVFSSDKSLIYMTHSGPDTRKDVTVVAEIDKEAR